MPRFCAFTISFLFSSARETHNLFVLIQLECINYVKFATSWSQNESEILFRKTPFSVSHVVYAAHNQFMHNPENFFWLICSMLKLFGV